MCLMAPATPIAESQPWCCCGTLSRFAREPRPSSRIVLASPVASLAQRTMLWHSNSALLSDTTFGVDDHVAKVCRPIRKLPPDVDRRVLGH